MPGKIDRVTEHDVGFAILQALAAEPSGEASMATLKKRLPNYLDLSAADRATSKTRHNEQIWEQQIRNIKSHSETAGNILCEGYAEHLPGFGYKITVSGRLHLKHKGF